jgi:hypothetical protein
MYLYEYLLQAIAYNVALVAALIATDWLSHMLGFGGLF